MKKNIFLFLILTLYYSYSQDDLDKQLLNSYKIHFDSLERKYNESFYNRDFINAEFYGNLFLEKAKKEKNRSKIIDGHYMMANTSDEDNRFAHADSIISFTKNEPTFKQPAASYLLKANYYAAFGKYKEAFNQLAIANKYATNNDNKNQIRDIKYILSRLKTEIGEYESSNESIRELLLKTYASELKKDEVLWRQYTALYSALANNFNALKLADSSKKVIKKAFHYSLKTKVSVFYNRLLLSSAISNYQLKNYKASMDSLIKLEKIEKKRKSNIYTYISKYLYKGKLYLKQEANKLAIKNFKIIDSITTESNKYFPDTRESYELLINHFEEKKDIENRLFYINKLLKADSILNTNNSYISKNINIKYTTPNLLLEKQKIINALKKDNSSKRLILGILFGFIALLTVTLFWNNKKRKLYKKRIESLKNQSKNKEKKSYSIDDETTKRILEKLDDIENSDLFLNEDFNLGALAKTLNTNTSYLSKIINQYKQKSFKQYLIELRINALLKNLDENPILRKHSIEALAQSIGYNNASSFTRIFKGYIGESPSYFLEKKYPERKK